MSKEKYDINILSKDIVRLDKIRHQVYEWSIANFGHNNVKEFDCLAPHTENPQALAVVPNMVVALSWLAPLIGIGEELGELAEASVNSDRDEVVDAIGDVGIYLCDYVARNKATFQQMIGRFTGTAPDLSGYDPRRANLHIAYGKLMHVHLKRFQGIRGLGDMETYETKRDAAVGRFVFEMAYYAKEVHRLNFVDVIETTWTNLVAKRDWKKNPISAT